MTRTTSNQKVLQGGAGVAKDTIRTTAPLAPPPFRGSGGGALWQAGDEGPREKKLTQCGIRLTDTDVAIRDALSQALGISTSEVFRRALRALATTLTPISNGDQTETRP